jgi:hypothetical protein
LALIITNVGALYRFRYTFWILVIALAVKGAEPVAHYCIELARRPLRASAAAVGPI